MRNKSYSTGTVPAVLIRKLAPLDTGQCVVQLLCQLADLEIVDRDNIIFVTEFTNRRDHGCGTRSEYFL